MLQTRLNAICNVHQDILDNLDISKLAEVFASRSDIRRDYLGTGCKCVRWHINVNKTELRSIVYF